MTEVGVTEARDQLGDLVSRAAYSDERIVLTRHGRAVAALVPIAVLRELEDAEDAADLAAAHEAAAESGPNVSHAQVLADLVADEARTSRSA
ncbi:MAG: type II toxin-antitoxin system Phd/YefM family antitoxin [Jatrophihabitans sp.]